MLLEKGKGKEFKGKSLDEVELESDISFSSDSEEEFEDQSLAERVLNRVRSLSQNIDEDDSIFDSNNGKEKYSTEETHKSLPLSLMETTSKGWCKEQKQIGPSYMIYSALLVYLFSTKDH